MLIQGAPPITDGKTKAQLLEIARMMGVRASQGDKKDEIAKAILSKT